MPEKRIPTRPLALLAASGLALAATSAALGQSDPLSEPFPSVFELSHLLAGQGGDGSLGFVIDSVDQDEAFGLSICRIGDINGDGLDDVAIGAPFGRFDASRNGGLVYLVFGSDLAAPAERSVDDLISDSGMWLFGTSNPGCPEAAGSALASLGDLDGDGMDELVIGAPEFCRTAYYPHYDVSRGRAYVLFGRDRLLDRQQLSAIVLESEQDELRLGTSVGSAGDFDGDGRLDIAAAGNGSDNRAFILYGKGIDRLYWLKTGTLGPQDAFVISGDIGPGITGLGDFNGDGLDDIGLVGRSDSYIVFGRPDRSSTPLHTSNIDGHNGIRLLGVSESGPIQSARFAGLGDVNGDGLDDVALGINGVLPEGGLLVLFGTDRPLPPAIDPRSITADRGVKIHWTNPGTSFGREVWAVGDVTGDGYGDMLVRGGSSISLWLILGGPGAFTRDVRLPANDPGRVIELRGASASGLPWITGAPAGDLNGDGRPDLVIAQSFSSPLEIDRAYVVYGRSLCTPDLDGNGTLTIFDFLEFQNLFDLMDPRADFDGDGDLTIFDFLAFQNAFDAGC